MNATNSHTSTRRCFSGKQIAIGGGALAAASVLAATLSIGAANATGVGSDDPSIRQAPGGSEWITEDTFTDPGQTDDVPAGIIEEGSDVPTDADMPQAPATMIEEGSDIDPDSDMFDVAH